MGEFYGNQHTESSYSDYEYEDLVEDVAALAEELGRPPTTEDANHADGLPSIAKIYRIIESDWVSTLRDAGVEPTKKQRRSVPADRRERMLEDLRRTNRETEGDILRLRQYDEYGSFDSSSMKVRFGSWAEACTEADIDCGTRHGIQCTGPQGNRLDSQHERLVAVLLDDCGIEYDVHPDVGNLGYEADFYLPALDLWIEVDGYVAGGRPNTANMAAKREYFESNGYDYVVVEGVDQLTDELEDRGVFPR
jgi:hypothetical protein